MTSSFPSHSSRRHVGLQVVDCVLVATVDNPPINALSVDVLQGLRAAIERVEADDALQAILIVGAGRGFSAGADLRLPDAVSQSVGLSDVCNRIEACSKLVIAAVHGSALGCGLEVALAAHYRVAAKSAFFGAPEVSLGLLPAAGGTQRLPRLVGAKAALELILSGRRINADEAHVLGLVDRLVVSPVSDSELTTDGIAFARELLARSAPLRRSRDGTALADCVASQAAIDAAREGAARRARDLVAPMKAVEAVHVGLHKGFDEGLLAEHAAFLECLQSPSHAALVHSFHAECEVSRIPQVRATKPRLIDHVGIVGGGTMGAGIAVAVLDAGLRVTMVERNKSASLQGLANVEKVYDGLIGKGRMTPDAKAAVMAYFSVTTLYDSLATVDLVIEAVFEDVAVKAAVFTELDRVCKAGALLATNTSYLDVDRIAGATSRPADVIGLHFFSPANIMKLLEVVVARSTGAEAVSTAFELAKRLRKVPVRAGVCDGFIGNRIAAVYRAAAEHLMEDGASPYQIDGAVRDFGYPMGPFQVVDLAGGDIAWATRKRRAATRDPGSRYVQIADRICERGWFGQKTGRGYYLYQVGDRAGRPDPEVLALIDAERARADISPRGFTDEEIMRRYLAAMINEGANVVHEGIALRPLDVDVVAVSGYGFPRFKGGPMFYADKLGLPKVLADVQEFAKQDPVFWRPSPLLVSLVEAGGSFADLNHSN